MISGPTTETNADAGSLTRGFLFADLRGYTDFADTHGDHAAAGLLERYRILVRSKVALSRGAEVKTEGDSFYVVFPSAGAAVRCGLAIIEAAAEARVDDASRPIDVGIGVHAGETVETAEGFVGSVINIAARICAQAKAGELVVSDTVRSLTRTYLDVTFVPLGSRRLKGVDEPIPLYRVVPARIGVRPLVGRTPARDIRLRPVAAVGALAVVVVAALVGGAVVLSGGTPATPGPTGQISASPAAGATGPVTPSSGSPSPSAGGLTAQERALLDRIPSEFQPYCRRSSVPDGAVGGQVSLRCDLPQDSAGYGADSVWYDTFDLKSQMQLTFNALVDRQKLPKGDCASSATDAADRWSLGTTFTGQLACYVKDKAAWLIWTYEGDEVFVRAVRLNGDSAALRTWWNEHAAPFLR